MIQINNFWGDLTDVSATTKTLERIRARGGYNALVGTCSILQAVPRFFYNKSKLFFEVNRPMFSLKQKLWNAPELEVRPKSPCRNLLNRASCASWPHCDVLPSVQQAIHSSLWSCWRRYAHGSGTTCRCLRATLLVVIRCDSACQHIVHRTCMKASCLQTLSFNFETGYKFRSQTGNKIVAVNLYDQYILGSFSLLDVENLCTDCDIS